MSNRRRLPRDPDNLADAFDAEPWRIRLLGDLISAMPRNASHEQVMQSIGIAAACDESGRFTAAGVEAELGLPPGTLEPDPDQANITRSVRIRGR